MKLLEAFVASVAIAGIGCGGSGTNKEPLTPDTTSSAPAPTVDPAVAGDRGDDPAPPKKRKPFEIHSSCGDIVTVVFAEDPKAADAGRRTIAPSSAIEGPRDSNGNQTVWLLDDKGAPLVRVHVTRGMKSVEVGRSCRTLDAH